MVAQVEAIFCSALFEIFGPNLRYSSQETKVNAEATLVWLWFFDVVSCTKRKWRGQKGGKMVLSPKKQRGTDERSGGVAGGGVPGTLGTARW